MEITNELFSAGDINNIPTVNGTDRILLLEYEKDFEDQLSCNASKLLFVIFTNRFTAARLLK